MGVTSLGPSIVSKVDGTPLIGPQIAANSLPVVLASDQPAITANTAAVATAAAPSYSEGTENPLSQTLAGDLRVVAKSSTLTPLGYQQIVGMVAATNLTVPAGATIADITIEGQPIRYRDDGTAPTSSVGMLLYQSQSFRYAGSLSAIQFIQTAATGTLDVSYYK